LIKPDNLTCYQHVRLQATRWFAPTKSRVLHVMCCPTTITESGREATAIARSRSPVLRFHGQRSLAAIRSTLSASSMEGIKESIKQKKDWCVSQSRYSIEVSAVIRSKDT